MNNRIHISLSLILLLACIVFSCASIASNVEGIQVYQRSIPLSLERKQKLAADINRYRNADNLWDVLRDEFSLSHYENNPAVMEKIDWFMNNQDFLLRSATRAAPYLYYISQQVKKRHLPAELVLLPIIESGYNPYSLSNVGAAGIWQLMPNTASGLGIKQDWWYDGRRDVIASTRAALNYLAYLQSFFEGNWLYAIAAYNTGEGNVLAAIKRNIRDGVDTDFWSLPVSKQTKDYVPSLLALAVIISHPDQYPIYFPPVRNAPYLAQVDVGNQINLKHAATLAGLSYKRLMQLNPGFNRATTSTRGPYKLVLPIENVEQFTENLTQSPLNSAINWIHYKTKPGDTLLSIAKKFNTTPKAIQNLNHLSKNSVHRGLNLLIPTKTSTFAASNPENEYAPKTHHPAVAMNVPAPDIPKEVLAQLSKNYTLQPQDTIYMVRNNDTLESISKHFHVHPQILQAVNKLGYKNIHSGMQIIIPTHLRVETTSHNKDLLPGDTLYMVRNGDTIEKIATRFHTTPAAIRLTNFIDDKSLLEGEKLIIPTGRG